MEKNEALVVLSGGQDSTTCLFWAKSVFTDVHAVTFNYGQRHILEIEAARRVAEMAKVASHEIVDVGPILKSTSPLVSSNPLEKYENFEVMDKTIGGRVELTFVPMRNTLFLTLAVNRAVALGCHCVVTGICQEDNANYPDCTEQFRIAFQDMANISLRDFNVEIAAPLMYRNKGQTVYLARDLPGCWEALAYTHTSYDGKYPPTDNNHSNVLRAQGFFNAGLPDPLVVRAWREGLMELPDTENYAILKGK